MSVVRFDIYYRYAELCDIFQTWARDHPQLVQLRSIGCSYEGRDIWLLEITQQRTGKAADKPGFWVDGNIHSAELVGSSACLYLIQHLLSGYGQDAEVTRCLDTRVFYICPRVNPDGAEWALAPVPKIVRSSTRPYPFKDLPQGGLRIEDVDGDGRILTMRVPDANGAWKKSPLDSRLLVPREPSEEGGEYFRLLPEGRIDNFDGFTIRLQDKRERLDLNRNFPTQWREEYEQKGAGAYPTSEPEVRSVVDFIAAQTNICGGITFHSYSGALLRPSSYHSDEDFPAEDLWTYQTLGQRGTALTGYPAVSVYHDFRYHPKEVITGALDDWLYDHRGVFAWTVEIWSPQHQAGIQDFKLFDWYRKHPHEDDLALLRWSDAALQGRGYIDWYPVHHPELGDIELGGWNCLYTFWNPPTAMLEEEIARFPSWVVWHCLLSPRLTLLDTSAEGLADGLYRIRLVVQNTGWLPSYISKQALKKELCRGVMAELMLPTGARLEAGDLRQDLGQLEGRAYKNCSPTGWAGFVADDTADRAKAEWVVRAAAATQIKLSAWHDRAGRLEAVITLE